MIVKFSSWSDFYVRRQILMKSHLLFSSSTDFIYDNLHADPRENAVKPPVFWEEQEDADTIRRNQGMRVLFPSGYCRNEQPLSA